MKHTVGIGHKLDHVEIVEQREKKLREAPPWQGRGGGKRGGAVRKTTFCTSYEAQYCCRQPCWKKTYLVKHVECHE